MFIQRSTHSSDHNFREAAVAVASLHAGLWPSQTLDTSSIGTLRQVPTQFKHAHNTICFVDIVSQSNINCIVYCNIIIDIFPLFLVILVISTYIDVAVAKCIGQRSWACAVC